MIATTLIFVGPFVLVLVLYYVFLRKRTEWQTLPLKQRVELIVSPLPILVGLVGSLTGYYATKQATTLVETGFARDNLIEVRNTAETAITLYAKLLLSVDRAHNESMNLHIHADKYLDAQLKRYESELAGNIQDRSEPFFDTLLYSKIIEHEQRLATRLKDVQDAVHNIAVHPFANACYRSRWRTRLQELFTTRVIKEWTSVEVTANSRTSGDFVAFSTLFGSAAGRLESAASFLPASKKLTVEYLVDNSGEAGIPQTRRQHLKGLIANDDVDKEKRALIVATLLDPQNFLTEALFVARNRARDNDESRTSEDLRTLFSTFLFLGNLISLQVTDDIRVLNGAAILADFVMVVPDQDELKACLKNYFANAGEGLSAASRRYVPILNPESVTSSLYVLVEGLQTQQFLTEALNWNELRNMSPN